MVAHICSQSTQQGHKASKFEARLSYIQYLSQNKSVEFLGSVLVLLLICHVIPGALTPGYEFPHLSKMESTRPSGLL